MNRWSQLSFLFVVVASVAMIYVYPLTLPTPLLDPDEGIHASIAQEMVESGDYLVPRFAANRSATSRFSTLRPRPLRCGCSA